MALGIGPKNQPGNFAVEGTAASRAGAAGAGGLLDETKDQKNRSTDPQFGEIMKKFQAQYGGKPAAQREIKKTLGKDDFLKIMITQMKNQDPTKPFDADQMAAQMAQYASVEQLQNVNQNIQKLQAANKTHDEMAMTSMIGKTVTVDRSRFPHIENQNDSLNYTLPRDAAQVHLMVVSNTGETILEKDIGAQKSGEQTFTWDGKKSNTLPAKNGQYFFKIIAQDSKGMTIPVNPKSQGRVIGVSFDGTDPVLLVGTAKNHQKVTFSNIEQIDDAPQAQAPTPWGNPQGEQGPPPKTAQAAPSGFFSFNRGQGSQGLDPSQLSPEAQRALAAYQAEGQPQPQPEAPAEARAEASAAANGPTPAQENALSPGAASAAGAGGNVPMAPKEKGFPNGLME